MDELQEKPMDSVVKFKSGKLITITSKQSDVCSQKQMINLLASSNRFGYIFYATENDGLAILSVDDIDRESRSLTKSSEDDDDDENSENENNKKNFIIRRPYIPGQALNKNSSIMPYWLSLNADETILSLVLFQSDIQAWLIIFYDVFQLVKTSDSTPLCPPVRLPKDAIGGIKSFAWNPAITNMFAYLDGYGSMSNFEIDNSRQLRPLGKCDANANRSSICWSPKGKQIVVVTKDGALELYDQNMILKKKFSSVITDSSFPPCISVLWLSTTQFLLSFSENPGDPNSIGNSYTHIIATYEKDQPPKTQIVYDLYFDTQQASAAINPQYYYARFNENKIIISGLSKSYKINVFAPDELNQVCVYLECSLGDSSYKKYS